MRRLIKFDIVHPANYLHAKQAEWADLADLTLDEYRARLNALRSNYSDYYTHPLNETGHWEAEEYYLMDEVFAQKVFRTFGPVRRAKIRARARLWRYTWRTGDGFEMAVADAHVRRLAPDVIFVRSQPIPGTWWGRFRYMSLLVARLSARMPRHWHPEDFDLVYTDQPDFQHFFRLHGVDTRLNDQGFDMRVASELADRAPTIPVSFVGGLGSANFSQRTAFFEECSARRPFPWWGYWWAQGRPMSDYPHLAAQYRGPTSGLEMYQTFRDTKVNLNDYVDTADGIGFNQRLFECLGSGGFLLTRYAHNFEGTFPEGTFATFRTTEECLEKIEYYLSHEAERAEIARAGQAFVAERYDFRRIALGFGEDLEAALRLRGR